MQAILIVRLGALGDIVHALPMAAALRSRFPEARLDWLVDERHLPLLELVPIVDQRVVWRSRGPSLRRRLSELSRGLRATRYDATLDAQGLIKSAVLARASGAARVIGFASNALREPLARLFYSESYQVDLSGHVIRKNLALAAAVGASSPDPEFPLTVPDTPEAALVREQAPYAVLNPGAAWPNKRWAPGRFGELARMLAARHDLRSVVTWGPDDHERANAVVDAAGGDAVLAPPTDIRALVGVLQGARLVVSGDTGPMHLAAALGTPVVALHGPTDPGRNGPWSATDVAVSHHDACRCQNRRRCRQAVPCLDDVPTGRVAEAVATRLGAEEAGS